MKDTMKKFSPFIHEHLDVKNELLQMARDARVEGGEKTLQHDLASVLIYSNIVEYLAGNLLESLNHLVKESTYKDFAGILYIERVCNQSKDLTLGAAVNELEKFSFPDKSGILACFKKISESRNRLFHNFAKSDIEKIKELVAQDLPTIQNESEEVITKINVVYAGLQKILVTPRSGEEKKV